MFLIFLPSENNKIMFIVLKSCNDVTNKVKIWKLCIFTSHLFNYCTWLYAYYAY